MYALCSKTVGYTESEIPTIKASPGKEAKQMMSLLATNVTSWAQAGQVPITFGQLLSGTPAESVTAAFTHMKEVAGDTIWDRFFVASDVTTELYVPFQLGTVLNCSLMRAEGPLKKFQKVFDYAQRAKDRFAELQASDATARSNRTGPYSQ